MSKIKQILKDSWNTEDTGVGEIFDILIAEMEVSNMDNDSCKKFLEQIIEHGCQSGILTEFITYYSCDRFFRKHYREILQHLDDIEYKGSHDIDKLVWAFVESWVERIYNDIMAMVS